MGPRTAAVIGGGPAGLMAAEVLSRDGVSVHVYDAMPSLGRKFLQAGVGGLNLTHAEPLTAFLGRYGARHAEVGAWLEVFGPDALRAWAAELGIETFVGTSQRVFPKAMKAAPLLRAWLRRLRDSGVTIHTRHRWAGWDAQGELRFATPQGERPVRADMTVLALGGGSWSRLGSNGAWVPLLLERGVEVTPLKPANSGFEVSWTAHFRERFAGQPVKSVSAWIEDGTPLQGEFVVTEHGVEGGLIYALSAGLRDRIAAQGQATLYLDLAPNRDVMRLAADLAKPRGSQSSANHLRKQAGIEGVKAGLLRETIGPGALPAPGELAASIKELPISLRAARPLDEAISSAGGIAFAALDSRLMLRAMPGVFAAGEMLDWEAPTGGYLLTACFASGRVAGAGAAAWLRESA